jgi:hypothetical protein
MVEEGGLQQGHLYSIHLRISQSFRSKICLFGNRVEPVIIGDHVTMRQKALTFIPNDSFVIYISSSEEMHKVIYGSYIGEVYKTIVDFHLPKK